MINQNKMNQKDKSTEEKILDAANKIFVEKGFDGSRMQEIANEAKINKSLLHYYYRSKEKLFAKVFSKVILTFLPDTFEVFSSSKSIFEKIEIFTAKYISLLQKNQFIPMFILHDLNKNKKKTAETFSIIITKLKNNHFVKFENQIQNQIQTGNIREISVEHLIINIMSLCIFPFVAKPIINKIFFDDNNKQYNKFIDKRKTEVADFIIQSIKI